MDLNLKGRSVLITGASRGIGLAIADLMAAEGCNLQIAARDQQKLEAAAERIIKQHGVKVTVHKRDLSLTPEVEALGRACQDVDILVNNAGDIPTGTLEMVDSTTWRQVVGPQSVRLCRSHAHHLSTHVCPQERRRDQCRGRGRQISKSLLHRRLHGQYRTQHVHPVPGWRQHA